VRLEARADHLYQLPGALWLSQPGVLEFQGQALVARHEGQQFLQRRNPLVWVLRLVKLTAVGAQDPGLLDLG